MDSSRRSFHTMRFPWQAALFSLALHALLAIALLPALSPPNAARPAAPPAPIAVRLLPPAPETVAPSPAAAPVAEDRAPVPAASPPSAQPSRRSERPADPAQPADAATEPGPGARAGIAARLLKQLAEHDRPAVDAAGSRLPWSSPGDAVPGLPGRRGWLSGHVGRAAPSTHRWQGGDGSARARFVFADGTAVCTQRRAPTIDEIMNPWKSTAVVMSSLCGREPPAPPDLSDPRVQPPPRARRGDGG